MLVRYGFDYKSTLGNTVLVEALSPNGTALFSQIDTLAPTGVYVSKEYIISLDALNGVTFRITPQNSNQIYVDNKRLNLFNAGANLFTNGDFNGNISGWSTGGGAIYRGFDSTLEGNGTGCLELQIASTNGRGFASQSLTMVNGNYYDFSYWFANISTYALIYSPSAINFCIGTNSNLTSLIYIKRSYGNHNYNVSTNHEFVNNKGVYKHLAASGSYFVGVVISRGEVPPTTGPQQTTYFDKLDIRTGTFSSTNLFANPNFAVDGSGWDYNNAVWSWDGGAMKFEVI